MNSSIIILVFFQLVYSLIYNIFKFFLSNIVDIATIFTPIIIAIYGYKYSKKQDEKILKDNEINRKANFQSSLILSDKMEIVLHTDSYYNYKECEKYQNVLLSDNKLVNGMCYGFDLILHFKNLTNIYPSKALIYKLQMWDNSSDVRNTKGNIIMFDFLNSNMEYTTAKIDKDKNTAISILCCVNKENMKLLEKYNSKDRKISISVKLSIKNSCGIITNCTASGTFIRTNITDMSSGASGGSKTKWDLRAEQAFLEIENIEEE